MPNLNTVDDLKRELGAGARQSKYSIKIPAPLGDPSLNIGERGRILCKGAPIPGKSLGDVEVWEQGRKLILPGDTEFTNSWRVEFYNRVDLDIQKKMDDWMSAIDSYEENRHIDNPENWVVTLEVAQLDFEGNETAVWELYNAYPRDIGEIRNGDDQTNTISTTEVEFRFSHRKRIK